MDLTNQTPAEIDGELARAQSAYAAALTAYELARDNVERIDAVEGYERGYRWNSDEARAKSVADAKAAADLFARLRDEEITPRQQEYRRRGGWTRYYLVTNAGGHVHASTDCSTCYPTTRYAWLTEQSGMTAEALVKEAGEQACTECFPWAPADTLRRKSTLEAPERKAARIEREKKAAAKAEKQARDGITAPDGSPLLDDYRRPFKTERAASIAAVQALANVAWYSRDGHLHPSTDEWTALADRTIEAIAAKHRRPVEEARAEIEAKVAAKVKRDEREAAKYAV